MKQEAIPHRPVVSYAIYQHHHRPSALQKPFQVSIKRCLTSALIHIAHTRKVTIR